MRRSFWLAAAIPALILWGCASAGTSPTHADTDVITREQIDAYHGETVYLLIQSLHANWLQGRGQVSLRGAAPVRVYVDGVPQYDGVQSLEAMRPRDVQEIRYLDARQATTRFGTGHTNGAILVTTRH